MPRFAPLFCTARLRLVLMAGFIVEPGASVSAIPSPSSSKRPRLTRPLDEDEERRIIAATDTRFLTLSREIKKRRSGGASLASVADLSAAAKSTLNFVLLIPPYGQSAGLRSQQLLRLTDLVSEAITLYDLSSASAKTEAFELLRLFDTAWVATLRGDSWDAALALPISSDVPGAPPVGRATGTDKARLLSLLSRTREGIRTAMVGDDEMPVDDEDDWDDVVDGYGGTEAGITQVGSVLGATNQQISRLFERTLTLLEARD